MKKRIQNIVAEPLDENAPVIAIRDLYKSFGDLHVLKGIDLDVNKGENVVVLGRLRSGKSVLITIISGLLKADRGSVKVLCQLSGDLNQKQLRELRMIFGFSF